MSVSSQDDALVAAWSRDWQRALPLRSPEDQAALREKARKAAGRLQLVSRSGGSAGHALHRRELFATTAADLQVSEQLPDVLRLGPLQPGARWDATLRLSSAFPGVRPDTVPDQRGIAVRIADGDRRLDLLATTGEAHHARDAEAMIASLDGAAAASKGGVAGRLGALATLVRQLGFRDGVRMTRTLLGAAQAGVSLAGLTFHSRAPFQLGPFAVRYRFNATSGDRVARGSGDRALSDDLAWRLARSAVGWVVQVQGYLDPRRTPMDDHRVRWDSPWLGVGTLTLPQGCVSASVEPLAFRIAPEWPDPNGPVFEPLGDLNLLRGAAYAESQAGRGV